MTKLDDLKALLKKHHLWAKKSLGQNFLVDEKALEAITQAAELRPNDVVVEVGPGTGFLTEELIEKVAHVTCIELDPDMIRVLQERFIKAKNWEVLHQDVLQFKIEQALLSSSLYDLPPFRREALKLGKDKYKLVANIPYYITSPLIKHFLHATHPPELMVILMQKEVAEKICGQGGKTLLSVQVEVFGQAELVAQVPASSFYPSPKVNSAVLRISPHPRPLVPLEEQKDFFRLVKFGYSQKRKKLSNTLAAGLHLKSSEVAEKMRAAGVDPNLRAEHLGVAEWISLTKIF